MSGFMNAIRLPHALSSGHCIYACLDMQKWSHRWPAVEPSCQQIRKKRKPVIAERMYKEIGFYINFVHARDMIEPEDNMAQGWLL